MAQESRAKAVTQALRQFEHAVRQQEQADCDTLGEAWRLEKLVDEARSLVLYVACEERA
jgi:hypothetical protein